MTTFAIIAQTATPAPSTSQPSVTPPAGFTMLQNVGPILLMVVVFFFIMNRSKKGTDKQRTKMLSELKKGDEVQTIGGILGKVLEAREDKVLLKVDENSNTKIWFGRSAIHRVVGVEDEKK